MAIAIFEKKEWSIQPQRNANITLGLKSENIFVKRDNQQLELERPD